MKRPVAIVALGILGVVLLAAVAQLFQWRLSSGDVFPAYSSLRDDPLGLGVLHDALAQMPEMRVDRNMDPLSLLPEHPARTIVLAGTATSAWSTVTRDQIDALNAAVRAGSRLVVAFRARAAEEKPAAAKKDQQHAAAPKPRKKDDEREPAPHEPEHVDLRRYWGAAPKARWLLQPEGGANRTEDAATLSLPARIAWASDTYFELDPAAGWRVLYRRGGAPVMAERTFGKGSIVLAGDSYFLSNEALQRNRSTPLLAWVVGPLHHVTFDESHLGVVAQRGVAALARRYGLWAAALSLLLLAALFIWQRSVWFVPPAPELDEVELTYHPAAGLQSLLRRSVPPPEVVAASVAEWRQTARDTDRQRIDAALVAAPKDTSPPELYNLLDRTLRRR
jgi:hypothetical protein